MKRLSIIITSLIMIITSLFMVGCSDDDAYTVTYQLNGGVFEDNAGIRYEYMTGEGEIYVPNPWKVGYMFVGWKEGNGTPKKDFRFNSDDAKDKTFVAVWEQVDNYIVILNLNYEFTYGGQTFVAECKYHSEQMASPDGFEIKYNDKILALGQAIPKQSNSFKFDYWEWIDEDGESVKITDQTMFNEKTFGEAKQIILNAKCISKFTPNA